MDTPIANRDHLLVKSQEHPLEAMYRARDALDQAAAGQAHTRHLQQAEFCSYGPVVVSTVIALVRLTDLLASQLANHPGDAVGPAALRGDNVAGVGLAVDHLKGLSRDLSVAATDAHRYWGAIVSTDTDTARPDGDMSQHPNL
jgi:hypothetical protein